MTGEVRRRYEGTIRAQKQEGGKEGKKERRLQGKNGKEKNSEQGKKQKGEWVSEGYGYGYDE